MENKTLKQELFTKNKVLFNAYLEEYDDKFGFKKNLLYRNKYRIALNYKKKKIKRSFSIWYDLPYALLIYAPNLKFLHHMSNYFYALKDGIIIKKHRRVYTVKPPKSIFDNLDYDIKSAYVKNNRNITGFDCYRIYNSNFLQLYEWIEEIADYNVIILGIELHKTLYPLEEISEYLKSLKSDLKYFFNILNDINEDLNIIKNYNNLDIEYNNNIKEIFAICQHIIK